MAVHEFCTRNHLDAHLFDLDTEDYAYTKADYIYPREVYKEAYETLVNNPSKNFTLVGDFGTGKSSFIKYFQIEAAKNRKNLLVLVLPLYFVDDKAIARNFLDVAFKALKSHVPSSEKKTIVEEEDIFTQLLEIRKRGVEDVVIFCDELHREEDPVRVLSFVKSIQGFKSRTYAGLTGLKLSFVYVVNKKTAEALSTGAFSGPIYARLAEIVDIDEREAIKIANLRFKRVDNGKNESINEDAIRRLYAVRYPKTPRFLIKEFCRTMEWVDRFGWNEILTADVKLSNFSGLDSNPFERVLYDEVEHILNRESPHKKEDLERLAKIPKGNSLAAAAVRLLCEMYHQYHRQIPAKQAHVATFNTGYHVIDILKTMPPLAKKEAIDALRNCKLILKVDTKQENCFQIEPGVRKFFDSVLLESRKGEQRLIRWNKGVKPDSAELWPEDYLYEFIIKEKSGFSSQTPQLPVVPLVSLEDVLSMKFENDKVECKTSLLWSKDWSEDELLKGVGDRKASTDTKQFGKDASLVVAAKAIAGFLNAGGGTLFVGVSEDKQTGKFYVSGIKRDQDRNNTHTDDAYIRQVVLEQVVRPHFPADIYVNSENYFRIDLIPQDDMRVCRITVAPSKKAVYLYAREKNGSSHQYLYKRRMGETRELLGVELADYLSTHFGGLYWSFAKT